MSQGSRPDRVADQIRAEIARLLGREVHDPGIGFVTLTRVQISPDLHSARVFYTALGDDKTRANSGRALDRAAPFLRRQIGSRLHLKRVPELKFIYDDSIAGQDRIEQILNQLHNSAGGPSERDGLEPTSSTNVRPFAKAQGRPELVEGRDAREREWDPASGKHDDDAGS